MLPLKLACQCPNAEPTLVRGRLVVHEPPGGKHGHVTPNLGARLWTHADLTCSPGSAAFWQLFSNPPFPLFDKQSNGMSS